MDEAPNENDVVRINLVKLFKHFGLANIPVDQKAFDEYCNKEGIKGITFEQYQDRLLDWKEDMIIRETLPHIYQILAEAGELHLSDFDLEAKTKEIAKNIRTTQAKIAHLLKRGDVPYDRHGDIMYTMSRLLNALLDQATDTNRRDISACVEHMAKEKFGRDMTMQDVAEYNQKHS